MKPYLVLVAVISAISATKVFEEVYIMTQGGPRNSSKTIVYYLYEQAFQNLEMSYACTIGLVPGNFGLVNFESQALTRDQGLGVRGESTLIGCYTQPPHGCHRRDPLKYVDELSVTR